MKLATVSNSIVPSPMENIIQSLKKTDWVFDALTPAFRSSLFEKLPGVDSAASTTLLCVLNYRKVTLPERMPLTSPTVLTFEDEAERLFWNQSLTILNKKVHLGKVNQEWRVTLLRALDIISQALPRHLEAFKSHISYICSVVTDEFRSASNPHYFGALFLAETDNPERVAISIIHEMAHQELFLINLIDRLIVSGSDFNLVHAPYQGVTRPPIGRLHSAHALFRMIQLEQIILPKTAFAHKELLRKTCGTFTKDELTPFARKIVDEVY